MTRLLGDGSSEAWLITCIYGSEYEEGFTRDAFCAVSLIQQNKVIAKESTQGVENSTCNPKQVGELKSVQVLYVRRFFDVWGIRLVY